MDVGEIITIVKEAGFSLPPAFQRETPEELSRFYNGVGPEDFPKSIRRFITWALERMEPLAFVHDIEYGTSEPNFMAFTVAQLRWAYNALRLAFCCSSHRYSDHKKRFLSAAFLCAAACQLCGWWGYKKGLEKK